MDLISKGEPDVAAVIFNKLTVHLQNLQFFSLFDVVADLETLLATILFYPALSKQVQVIRHVLIVVKNLFLCSDSIVVVERRKEFEINSSSVLGGFLFVARKLDSTAGLDEINLLEDRGVVVWGVLVPEG